MLLASDEYIKRLKRIEEEGKEEGEGKKVAQASHM